MEIITYGTGMESAGTASEATSNAIALKFILVEVDEFDEVVLSLQVRSLRRFIHSV